MIGLGNKTERLPSAAIVGILALVCAITAEELLGYHSFFFSFGTDEIQIPFYTLLTVVQLIAALFLFLIPISISSLPTVLFKVTFPALALLGSGLLIASQTLATSDLLPIMGFSALAICGLWLKIMLLEILSCISLHWAKRMIVASVLLQTLMAPLFLLQEDTLWWLFSLLFLLIGFFFANEARDHSSALISKRGDRKSRPYCKETTFSGKIILGIGVILLSIGFLSPWIILDTAAPQDFFVYTFSTHALSALLFALFVFRSADIAYTLAFKTIESFVLISFILFAVLAMPAYLPRFLCTAALSLFEFITYLAVADLASYSKIASIKLFSGYYLIMRSFMLAGSLLSPLENRFFASDASYSVVGIGIAVAMAITAIWLINEKNIFDFFWGGQRDAMTGNTTEVLNATDFISSAVDKIAASHSLSPRETDVLSLLALGRSSVFIAEELFLSNNTVRKHIASIYTKCDVHSKQELLTLVQTAS